MNNPMGQSSVLSIKNWHFWSAIASLLLFMGGAHVQLKTLLDERTEVKKNLAEEHRIETEKREVMIRALERLNIKLEELERRLERAKIVNVWGQQPPVAGEAWKVSK